MSETLFTEVHSDAPDHTVSRRLHKSINRERYEEFISEYPWLIDLVIYFSLEVKQRGYKKYGMKAILERVRWHLDVDMYDAPEFIDGAMRPIKINNNHAPFLSRDVMQRCEALRGFFETREQAVL